MLVVPESWVHCLEGISARGPYSLLASAEENVSRLKEDVRSEQLQREAIRLLRSTVAQCRMEVIAAIAQPVETAATRTFQRIASRRIGRIHIGEVLQPTGVIPEALGKPVEIDNISGGEQEQLYLATRLALADVLTRDERQGTYTGIVAIRASGYFDIKDVRGKVFAQGISHKYMRLLQHADGYAYAA